MNRRTFAVFAILGLVGCTDPKNRPIPLDSLSPDEKKAVGLAKALLAEEKIDWGDPTAVKPLGPGWEAIMGERANCLLVVFATPEKELPLLGDRTVMVNVSSGKAMISPRE